MTSTDMTLEEWKAAACASHHVRKNETVMFSENAGGIISASIPCYPINIHIGNYFTEEHFGKPAGFCWLHE